MCRTSKSGVLNRKQRMLVGRGLVVIEAHLARTIPEMFNHLKPDHMLASAEDVARAVQTQLCSWCDGMGWQIANMGEDVAGCPNCAGTGIEPPAKRRIMTIEPLPKKWDESPKGCFSAHPLSRLICQRKKGNHKIHKRLHSNKRELETWT